MFKFKFEAMGTELEIQIFDSVSKILEEKIKSEIFDYTVWFDESLSRFKDTSIVTKVSKNVGTFTVPKELVTLLKFYEKFNEMTDGSMNPLLGNTLSDLGYDKDYTLIKKENVSKTPDFQKTLWILGDDKIKLNEKVLIDVGAIGKGFWIDKVREILERNKLSNFLINGSGDIYVSVPAISEAVEIGMENSEGKVFENVKMKTGSICGSGTNKRNWSMRLSDNLHHIIDAKTSKPTDNILSVWIKTPRSPFSTTLADGLAKAIFFVEPETLQTLSEQTLGTSFEFYIIYANKKTLVSKNFFI